VKSIHIVIYALVFGSLLAGYSAYAQFIPYSQYHNAPLLTNPASPALTDYTQVTVHYRRSRIANYDIPSVSFIHPFYRQANGMRYGGIGANIINQQAGPGGMYKVTGFTGTFAYTLHLSKTHHLGAGLGGGIINKRIDASRITTDAQYSLGVYDPSLNNAENFQSTSVTRPVINAGLSWLWTDENDQQKATLGLAAYNMNKPAFDLLDNAAGDNMTYVISGEMAVLTRNRITLSPTFRYIYQQASTANIGARISYTPTTPHNVLSAGLWYKTTGALVAGAQYNYKAYVIAASMDFSIASGLDANINNAVEVVLGWRMNRKEKIKTRTPSAAPAKTPDAPKHKEETIQTSAPATPKPDARHTQPASSTSDNSAKDDANTKGNAAAGNATPGSNTTPETPDTQLQAVPVIGFGLGSNQVTAEGQAQLEDLAAILKAHPEYTLKITGHGCTQGERHVTEKISLARAQAVADILIEKGVPREQLEVAGMGARKPVASNATKTGRQKNRRVEFEWIKK
jgi:type IX secretion system PorP/SprF family membrane protein